MFGRIRRRFSTPDLKAIIKSKTGLVPIYQHEPEDVFVVGYPKSGNTWFQSLLAGVVYGINSEYVPDSVIQDLVPDIHAKRYYRRYSDTMFFKSHELPNPQYRRVVYLLRDGRDVMVSYFHHNVALYGSDAADLNRMVQFGEGVPCKWHEHVEAWLDNPHGADMIVIRYEDLHRQPVVELERFCSFVGISRAPETLDAVIKASSFEVMQAKEQSLGWSDSRWPTDKLFTRRGKIGSYIDELPQSVLEIFMGESGTTLRKLGYA